MPKLWNDTIEAHRRAVHEAIADTAAVLVSKHGLAAVTMSQIAEETGIGRATLYKYFPDVGAIMHAWHERQITGHFDRLAEVRDKTEGAGVRLQAVLEAYAVMAHETHGMHDATFAAFLHQDEQVVRAQERLRKMIRDLLRDAQDAGDIRDDTPPGELASYCLHALTAAGSLPSKAAVRRLVRVTLAALRAPRAPR